MHRNLVIVGLVGLALPELSAAADIYAWDAPGPATQLVQDESVLPAGHGGVFFPSLTKQGGEPDALVVDGGKVIRVPVGRRVALPPGQYVALVGSGEPDLRQPAPFAVAAGVTTTVHVTWGGLRLDIVDRQLRPRRLDYRLVHVGTEQAVTVPVDLRVDEGEHPATWLLQPGLYRVEAADARGVTSPDFATVHVPPGGLAHLRVFVDRAGRLVGSGVVPGDATVAEPASDSRWTSTLVIGAEGSWSESRNTVGAFDQRVANGSAFIDASAGYADERNLIDLTAEVEQGMLLIQPSTGRALPPLKSRDRLAASAGYTFLLNEGVGVFARVGADTRILPTDAVAAEDTDVAFRLLDGGVDREPVTAPETYRIANAWAPTVVQTAVGLRARLSTWKPLDLSLLGGVGYRRYFFDGAFVPDDNPQTPDLEYTQVASFDAVGGVAGASGTLRITRFATYKGGLEVFVPLTEPDAVIVAWDNELSLRLTRALSVNYRANLSRLPQATSRTAFSQGVFLRVSWDLL